MLVVHVLDARAEPTLVYRYSYILSPPTQLCAVAQMLPPRGDRHTRRPRPPSRLRHAAQLGNPRGFSLLHSPTHPVRVLSCPTSSSSPTPLHGNYYRWSSFPCGDRDRLHACSTSPLQASRRPKFFKPTLDFSSHRYPVPPMQRCLKRQCRGTTVDALLLNLAFLAATSSVSRFLDNRRGRGRLGTLTPLALRSRGLLRLV